MKLNQKGITLIELLIVVIVLGVIASISIPAVGSIVENTRISTDHANTTRLNQATRLFQIANPQRDDFNDTSNTPLALMQVLNQEGFISAIVEPQASDGNFSWDFDNQIWLYNHQYVLIGDAVASFDPNFFGGNAIQGPYAGTQSNIVIPDVIDGNDIKYIYQDAFRFGTGYSQTQLTSVSFTQQSQLERIHARAFRNNNLTSITLPESLKRIDWGAFFENNNLVSITIGSNVTIIEDNAFRGNNAFRDAYQANGAGTYIWNGSTWVKDN